MEYNADGIPLYDSNLDVSAFLAALAPAAQTAPVWGDQNYRWVDGAQSGSQSASSSGNSFTSGQNQYFQYGDLSEAQRLANQYGGEIVRANPTYSYVGSNDSSGTSGSLGSSYYWSPQTGDPYKDFLAAQQVGGYDQGGTMDDIGEVVEVVVPLFLAWAAGGAAGLYGGPAAGAAEVGGGMAGAETAGGGLASGAAEGTYGLGAAEGAGGAWGSYAPQEGLWGDLPSGAASDFGYGFDPSTGAYNYGADYLPNEGLMGETPTGGAASDFGTGVNPTTGGLNSDMLKQVAKSLSSAFGGGMQASGSGSPAGGGMGGSMSGGGMSGGGGGSQSFGLTQAPQMGGQVVPQGSAFIQSPLFTMPGSKDMWPDEQANSQNIMRLAQALRQPT